MEIMKYGGLITAKTLFFVFSNFDFFFDFTIEGSRYLAVLLCEPFTPRVRPACSRDLEVGGGGDRSEGLSKRFSSPGLLVTMAYRSSSFSSHARTGDCSWGKTLHPWCVGTGSVSSFSLWASSHSTLGVIARRRRPGHPPLRTHDDAMSFRSFSLRMKNHVYSSHLYTQFRRKLVVY